MVVAVAQSSNIGAMPPPSSTGQRALQGPSGGARHMEQLEPELSLVMQHGTPGTSSSALQASQAEPSVSETDAEQTLYFRPVEGSMSHFTVLGPGMPSFDFMMQQYVVHSTGTCSLNLVPSGEPVTCLMSDLDHDHVSGALPVWRHGDTDFAVCRAEHM